MSRSLAFAALALPLAFATPAAADPASPDCMANAQTTLEMSECAHADRTAADAELNRVYGQLLASLADAGERAALKKAERAWITFRDAHCAFATFSSRGGTIHGVEVASCLADTTRARTAQLREAIEAQKL